MDSQKWLFPDDFNYSPRIVRGVQRDIYKIVKETITPIVPFLKLCKKNTIFYKWVGYDILIDENMKCHLCEINTRFVSPPRESMRDRFYKDILGTVFQRQKGNYFVSVLPNIDTRSRKKRTQKKSKNKRKKNIR